MPVFCLLLLKILVVPDQNLNALSDDKMDESFN